MANSQDIYGNFGSVPNQQNLGGSGAHTSSVSASPNDFGAQIGKGVESLGAQAGQVVDHFGGMILETAANDAEVNYTKAAGELKAKYSQYKGLQAEAMRPQYEADLEAARQQYASGLPLKAQHVYNISTSKSAAYQSSSYNDYAADQVHAANRNSQLALMDSAVAKTSNMDVLLNPSRFGEEVLHPIIAGGNALSDLDGYSSLATGQNPDTGNYSYPDTPEGKAAEAAHLATPNAKLAAAYTTAAQTIADNKGASGAAEWLKSHWDMMPDAAKVQTNKFLAPKIKNEIIAGSIINMNNRIQSDFTAQTLSHVPSGPLDDTQSNQNMLDVIRKNEGYNGKVVPDNNIKPDGTHYNVINGINEKSYPKQFEEAKAAFAISKEAGQKYTDDFYQKEIIDKNGINMLPPATQAIVADGIVNHGAGDFGKSLIKAAENGASPQELIDMRRDKYNRLAATGNYDKDSIDSWSGRLDALQNGINKQVGNAVQQGNMADFLKEKEDEYVQGAVDDFLKERPDDYYGSLTVQTRARNQIKAQITAANRPLQADQNAIDNAISGALTKGVPVADYNELASLPGMNDILQRVGQQQAAFHQEIDTKIAKASHSDTVHNTKNGYDAILNTLSEGADFTRQNQIEYLSKGLGSTNPGYSISYKDFQDAKSAIDLPDGKTFLSDQMKEIASANGNIDGKGEQRAIAWYNQTMKAWKNANASEKAIEPQDFFSDKNKELPVADSPSRMTQINNQATAKFIKENPFDYNSIPTGQRYTAPDGTSRIKK